MRLRTRIIAGALAAMMMLSFGACGKKQEGSTSSATTDSSVESNKDAMFGYSDMSFDGIEGSVAFTAMSGDQVVFYATDYEEDTASAGAVLLDADGDTVSANDSLIATRSDSLIATNSDSLIATNSDALISGDDTFITQTQRIYVAPATGGTAELIKEVKGQTASAEDIAASADKIVVRYVDMANEKAYLEILDKSGNTINQIDVSKYAGFEVGEESAYISGTYLTDDDNIILALNDTVKVVDLEGNEKANVKLDTFYITGGGVLKDGTPFIAYYQDEATKVSTIDIAGAKLGETYDVSAGFNANAFQKGFGNYDLILSTNTGEYGYVLKSGETTKLCDYNASDMNVTYLTHTLMLNDQTILLTSMDGETGNSKIELFNKLDPSEIQDKTELTIMTFYAGAGLKDHVIEFNKSHSDIRITIKDYSETDDAYGKMSADVSSGNLPDLFVVNGGVGDMSIEQCVSKGIFEDLMPYIEADPELSESDFVPSVFNAMKFDGKLYYASSAFSINALISGDKSLAGKDGWTFQEMKEFVDSKPEDTRLFESGGKTETLGSLFITSVGDFVDWRNGECSFDSQEFKDLLEMANRGAAETEEEFDISEYANDLQSGKQLFVNGYLTAEELCLYDKMFGNNAAYIGYPNKEKQGIYASMDISYAISSTCKDKDAAWEFVRTYLTKEYQGKIYTEGNISCPTRQDVFDDYMEALKATKPYTDEFGNEITPLNGTIGFVGLEVEKKPLTDAEVKNFTDLVGRISRVWDYDTSLIDIVNEEAAPYFAGDKTVDEVASTIQNRAKTYIQENR